VSDLWTGLLGCLDLGPQRALHDGQSDAHDGLYQVTVHRPGRSFAALTIIARQTRGVLLRKENCSHTAQDTRHAEFDSPNRRIMGSENGFGVDTRRWLMTELPQILSATNYAVAARGEAL
jgi:hypothetical protein